VTEGQIIVAAEITQTTQDQGHLIPLVDQARDELSAAGAPAPQIVLADAGYWRSGQITQLLNDDVTVLVPPDKDIENPSTRNRGPGSELMRERLQSTDGARLYARRMPMIEPVFGQTKHNRKIDRFQRRGLPAVRSEWRLITATHNLLKLWRHAAPAVA
jgi:hypothetical protein